MTYHKKVFAAALVALLAACDMPSSSVQAVSDLSTVPPQQIFQSKTVACPSQNFDAFFKVFAEDVSVQKAFTANPLQSESIDAAAQPEPQPVSKMLDETELSFPLMPSLQKQTAEGLKQSRTDLNERQVEVTLTKEDTDYQMSFFFKKNSCWMLYRMRDDSL